LNKAVHNKKPVYNEYQLYICGLPLDINNKYLFDFFSRRYYSITAAKIITDNYKYSKGYAFVKFSNVEEYEDALVNMNGIYIRNRQIRVK
jgi:RNA recognition motif-containing protein